MYRISRVTFEGYTSWEFTSITGVKTAVAAADCLPRTTVAAAHVNMECALNHSCSTKCEDETKMGVAALAPDIQ